MWAFCVGVQAEDVGCLPSPSRAFPQEASEKGPTPPLLPWASPHLTHGTSALVQRVHFFKSRDRQTFEMDEPILSLTTI